MEVQLIPDQQDKLSRMAAAQGRAAASLVQRLAIQTAGRAISPQCNSSGSHSIRSVLS
jgi:hypothetical protein